jgi:hypothetical protein
MREEISVDEVEKISEAFRLSDGAAAVWLLSGEKI